MGKTKNILISLTVAAILGSLLHPYYDSSFMQTLLSGFFVPVGQVFLRLLLMVVTPLVFSALVLGIYEIGKGPQVGRIAFHTLAATLILSSTSVFIGMGLINLLKPGQGELLKDKQVMSAEGQTQEVEQIKTNATQVKSISQILVELVPKNPLAAATKALEGEMISLMVFALIFGLALSHSFPTPLSEFAPSDPNDPGSVTQNTQQEPWAQTLLRFFEDIFKTCMTIINWVLRLAPLGIFALIFNTSIQHGPKVFVNLIYYVGTVVLGLCLQQFIVYGLMLRFWSKISPIVFFKKCFDVYLYAFSTASSNATLPKALEVAETRLNIPSHVSRFVLTLGSTANQNGTALFEGVTVLFLAQVYGVDLSFSQQLVVVLMSILAGIGTAGVPGGSLPLIMILLQQVGVPPEGLGLILGVDRLLDMCRTTVNVSGDLVVAQLVSSSLGPARAPPTTT